MTSQRLWTAPGPWDEHLAAAPAAHGRASSRPWWLDVSAAVGLLGILVTLVFSAIAATQQARGASDERLFAQVGVLADLDARAVAAQRAVNERVLEKACSHTFRLLTAAE